MMKNTLLAIAIIGLVFLWAQELQARFTPISINSENGPIVVELFTSQGCSSCPPADQVINQLSDNPNFIPLSYHVTYWDYIGWKDSLGRGFSDKRQRSYSRFKNSSRVYTPQMIINGGKEFVGSRKHEANRNLSNAKPVAQIQMAGMTPEGTMITLPQVRIGSYTLWIAGIKKETNQKIGRGENHGKTVKYNDSVVSFKQGESWNGTSKTMTLNLPKSEEIDHYVILAQERAFGPIIAAGKIGI